MAGTAEENISINFQLSEETLQNNVETVAKPIIKVFGVGGGGSNAVSYMHSMGISDVDFVVCNTDKQALIKSPVQNKIQIGKDLTSGLGAGSRPEVGRLAAEESAEIIRQELSDGCKMVFITVGMGGGTGTGAAPVVAAIAKELGLLTVGIVTIPFVFEGPKRIKQANDGVEELKKHVDSLIVIENDKVREQYGKMKMKESFAKADNVVAVAAKGISQIITKTGDINVDFEDVKTTMSDSGVAIMGIGVAEGENRAMAAVEAALTCPLLNNSDISGAKNVLLYVTGPENDDNAIETDEFFEICQHVQQLAGNDAELIYGTSSDPDLEKEITVTLVATNFNVDNINEPEKVSQVIDFVPEKPEVNPASVEESEKDILLNNITIVDNSQPEEKIENELPLTTKQVIQFEPNIDKVDAFVDESVPEVSSPVVAPTFSPMKEEVSMEESVKEPQVLITDQDLLNESRTQKIQEDRRQSIDTSKELTCYNYCDTKQRSELENRPAYERRRGALPEDELMSEMQITSSYKLSDDEESGVGVKKNNTFLFDNVD